MPNKKAIVTSYADWLKGFMVALVIGLIVIFLVAKGIITIPFL